MKKGKILVILLLFSFLNFTNAETIDNKAPVIKSISPVFEKFDENQKKNADLNEDEKIDEKDVEILKRHLVGDLEYQILPYKEAASNNVVYGDVTLDGKVDEMDLILLKKYLENDVEFNGGEKVYFEIDAYDDVSGIDNISISFLREDAPTAEGTEYRFYVLLSKDDVVFSNAKPGLNKFENGKKVYAGYVPNDVKEGKYKFFDARITDEKGNYNWYCSSNYYNDSSIIVENFNFPSVNVSEFKGDKNPPILKNLNFSVNKVKIGEEILIEAEVEDESDIEKVELFLGANVYNLTKKDGNLYSTVINFPVTGNYKFKQISIMDINYNMSSYFYKSVSNVTSNNILEDDKYDIVVVNEEESNDNLPEFEKIVITKKQVKAPSSFEINIYSEPNLQTSLVISGGMSNGIIASDEGWVDDHYVYKIDVTQYVKPDTYYIELLYLTRADGKTVLYASSPNDYDGMYASVKKIEGYAFDVVDDLKADAITSVNSLSILDDLKNTENNSLIAIDTTKSTNISSEIFDAIKGTNKTIVFENNGVQWQFNGNDIVNLKDIDVTTNLYLIKQYEKLNDEENAFNSNDKVLVIEFADNGELPGKALIRIKADYALRNYLGDESLTLYYKNDDKYDIISSDILESQNEFYEFYIDHNSTYYLTNKKVEKEKVNQDYTEELGNKKLVEEIKTIKQIRNESNSIKVDNNNKTENINYIPYIVIAVSLTLVIIVTVIAIKRNKSKFNM